MCAHHPIKILQKLMAQGDCDLCCSQSVSMAHGHTPGEMPRIFKHGDLTLVVDDNQGWQLTFQSQPGEDLSMAYDLGSVEVVGSIGPVIPVQFWSPHLVQWQQAEPQRLDSMSMPFHAFTPAWTKSWNATIVVPT